MKNIRTSILVGIALAVLSAINGHAEPQPLPQGIQEVIQLTQAGIGEDIILRQIAGRGMRYDLTVDQIIALKNLGVKEVVISALLPASVPTQTATQVAVAEAPATPVLSAGSPSTPPAPTAPSFAEFQARLTPFGAWVNVPGYGPCWQPAVEVADPNWRPYFNCGNWAYTEFGWNWQSDYPWGGVVFHHGRWVLVDRQWAWVPGYDWAPAWVTWRESEGYCGWAPLPPAAEYRQGVGLCFGGVLGFDVDFGLDPDCFSFVPYDRFWDRDLAGSRIGHEERERVYHNSHIANGYRVDHDRFIIEGPGRERVARFSHHDAIVEAPRIEIGLPSVGFGVGVGIGGGGRARAAVSAPAVVVATPRIVISSPAVDVRPHTELVVALPRTEVVVPKIVVEQPHAVVVVKTPSVQVQARVSATTTEHKHDH